MGKQASSFSFNVSLSLAKASVSNETCSWLELNVPNWTPESADAFHMGVKHPNLI